MLKFQDVVIAQSCRQSKTHNAERDPPVLQTSEQEVLEMMVNAYPNDIDDTRL